ncbi:MULTISPECIES: Ogr/Delta-like zinc finger protein [Vibrio]|uniref:Ogr/Delta-like zinc finger n=5 Tax=Vibrio TaxID=662 RepID=A0A1R4LQU4_VIBR1|nr:MULTISPECIES: ogr/Delta-like zinc finger family protein [Vibrio]ASA57595.1 transcriptional regulator [Vibrio gazogenes]MDW6094214.1 ogr/Delta-like zinc finger family protein [Vibrio rhizosphaerae]QMV16662.1 Ogr/Delta-like zinc finger [Vibrio spartinae]USP16266.1 ogr/Delta-like zinc finger family protein [Vibrio gazogenes]WNJ97435.1 ogr/Delta-like zinc finger family protein [Vibrio ruber]
MRVLCPECGQKSRIQKSNRITNSHADLYCSCSDPECGHTFVMNLSYSHTLSPSAKAANQLVCNLIKSLPPESRASLQQELSLI